MRMDWRGTAVGFGLLVVMLFGVLGGNASSAPPGVAVVKPNYGDHRLVFPRFTEDTPERYEIDSSAIGIGDLNGDGAEEIATMLDATFGPEGLSQVVVTIGGTSSDSFSGAATAFRVLSPDSFSSFYGARRAAAVGDLNGDGRGEMAIASGESVYVVFGRLDGAVVNLSHLGADGFEIAVGEPDDDPYHSSHLSETISLVSPGDMNGDGRDDLAFASTSRIAIFFTPRSPADQTFDGSDAGQSIEFIPAQSSYNSDDPVRIEAPGDLDGDGLDDLIIYTPRESGGGRVVGLMSAGPGRDVDLDRVAERGLGFELHGRVLRAVVGDVNGDGRSDLLMASEPRFVEFSPGRGVERGSAGAPLPGEGKALPRGSYYPGWDAGDVDGDGLSDLAFMGSVIETNGADMGDPSSSDWDTSENRLADLSLQIVDQLQDSNGDGLPEVLVVRSEPYGDPRTGNWSVETYLSRRIEPISPKGIKYVDGGVIFSGSIDPDRLDAPGFHEGAQLRASVDLNLPDRIPLPGGTQSVSAERRGHAELYIGSRLDLDTGAVKAFFPLALDPLGIGPLASPGDRVGYRIEVTGFGTLARAPWNMFKYDPPPLGLLRKKNLRKLRGTKGRDRLVGSRRSDRISAGSGKDRLKGGAKGDRLLGGKGPDELSGGIGDDLLQGGPGRDEIDCGDGFDMADVGPKDIAVNCEALFAKA